MSAFTPSPHDPVDVLDTPIADVIRQSDVSVRLNNALINAGNSLPFHTVREYLEAGSTAKDKFLIVPNLGRRSANELDDIVRAFVANCPAHPPPVAHRGSKLGAVRHTLVRMFSEFHFPDVFLEGAISTRLANALRSNPQLPRRLSKFLEEFANVCNDLRRAGNVGVVSITELTSLAKAFTAEVLGNAGFSEEIISYAHGVIFEDHITSEEALAKVQDAATNVRPISADDLPSTHSAQDIVSEILSILTVRDRAVLERRYGFISGRVETLEEIAVDYQVTRERIRQIEAKNLRQIGRTRLAKPLRAAFDQEIGNRLMAATSHRGFIKDDDKSQTIRRLSAADRFAIDVLYEDRDKFLRKFARRWHGGWILPPLVKDELQELLRQVKARLALACLPAAFRELSAGLPETSVRTVVELGTDLSIVEGYLMAGRVGARPLRTIRLHRCLIGIAGMVEVGDLIARYRQAAPADKHSSVRDAMIVMLMAPHLFLGVFDRHWYGLGEAGSIPATTEICDDFVEPNTDNDDVPTRPDEEGIRSLLRQILLDRGPLRFVDLRERAKRRLHGKSPHSVGPILLTSGEFVRPLPGIYALPEQISAVAGVLYHPPFLLVEEQARYLAEARYAGEPFGRYPMWSPEAEYALCRWAQANSEPLTFQSLLAVASVDLWPVSSEERQHWSALKLTHGRYCLSVPPRYPIRQLWPPLDRLLAACIVAHQNVGLSWIAANRVLKRRLDAHVSPGLLALMVALGALQGPSQWQMFHKAGLRLQALIQDLSRYLHENGSLEWSMKVGEDLIRDLACISPTTSLGWVDANVIQELISAAGDRAVTSLPTAGEADESTSSFEDLMREVASTRDSEAAHEKMRAILTLRGD